MLRYIIFFCLRHAYRDLILEKHVSKTCAAWFYWLRRIRKSLDGESASTLIHALVTSRVNYCNALYAGSAWVTEDNHWQAVSSTQCHCHVVCDTRKFDRSLSAVNGELRWLDLSESIT